MKALWALPFIVAPFLQAGQEVPPKPVRPFTISLPLNVDPETALIETGVSGQGLFLSQVQTRRGVYDYPVNLRQPEIGIPRGLKLLIYIPGYRMVASDFDQVDLLTGKVFIPPLVPLATTTVRGTLVDSSEKPLPDQVLTFRYSLTEAMDYFNYFDGSVPILNIASVKTDTQGEFKVDVPSLPDDPFFSGRRLSGHFEVISNSTANGLGNTLDPRTFSPKKIYPSLLIKKTQKGMFGGKIGPEFFKRNNLSEDLRVYVRRGDTIVTGIELRASAGNGDYNANLKVDGTFDVQVPPAKYTLELWVPRTQQHIPIRGGILVEEGRPAVIDVP